MNCRHVTHLVPEGREIVPKILDLLLYRLPFAVDDVALLTIFRVNDNHRKAIGANAKVDFFTKGAAVPGDRTQKQNDVLRIVQAITNSGFKCFLPVASVSDVIVLRMGIVERKGAVGALPSPEKVV